MFLIVSVATTERLSPSVQDGAKSPSSIVCTDRSRISLYAPSRCTRATRTRLLPYVWWMSGTNVLLGSGEETTVPATRRELKPVDLSCVSLNYHGGPADPGWLAGPAC